MDSPAKGDNRQGLKASQKHIEFQLQREKAYTRELEERLKTQQAQIAKLDQDKAELRRELVTLTDDDKKKTKLEERCHALQKELAEKQAALVAEQKRITSTECEKEQIRRDAHASIAKWCEAEKQWIAENEALQKELDIFKEQLLRLQHEFEELVSSRADVLKQLQCEREHSSRLESAAAATEKKIASLHSRIESLQNDIYTRDETVFKLDEAGNKWQEICHSKDDEIRSLELQNAKQSDTIERLQTTISTLNQRIEAIKLLGIEEKGHTEKISCDLHECKKENKLLQLELETVRRDLEHASQNASKQQEMILDLRTKLASSTDQLKEKNTEIRKQELTISQLTADIKREERERSDNGYLVTSLENQLQTLRNGFEEAQSVIKSLHEEKALIEVELHQTKVSHEAKDEAVVLMKSELEDKIEGFLVDIKNLESEVTARQQMINSITRQLGDANLKNEELHERVLQDSDLIAQFRTAIEELQKENKNNCFEQLFQEEAIIRSKLCEQYLGDMCDTIFHHTGGIETLLRQCFNEISRLDSVTRELDTEKIAAMHKLDAMELSLEEEIQKQREREAKQTHEIETRNVELVALQNQIREYEESLTLLKSGVEEQRNRCNEFQRNNKLLSDKLVATENILQEMSISTEKHVYFSECATRWLQDVMGSLMFSFEHYAKWMLEKADIVGVEFYRVHVKEKKRVLEALDYSKKIQRETEERCTHLHLQLRNAEFSLGDQEKATIKKNENLLSEIRLIEKQRDAADKMKEEVMQKLDSVSNQLLAEKNTKDERIRGILVELDIEKHNTQLIENKLQKLQKNFDYELGRKMEYKKALQEVKARREEAERYRATEKDWAMKAISCANEEVNYWVKSFEKLKSMLDELSSRSGARVSAVDQATINSFEEAKNRLVLRDQDVNVASSEEVRCRGKRARIE
ncbi:BRCT domain-containing protein [Trypanosoma rangeli]|uniref:BRCT domain-containing protein n=1 Tax=Trypanosoma rangeli TaxID=5698 RepID=A0A3R7LAM9_TRYRA|nr:BRCT domain-containing protein [Trypanosoma rangeli]RNF10507.1 BRCT domain-containing protein [Trypanosoma rangeli]|eukprot:RNF10507.1 BRCT domain-containing protein [Trypanosoma rangeli]